MIRMSQQSSGSIHQEIGRLFSPGSPGTTLGLGEAGLLARFVDRRDEAAFEALVARFGPMVLGVCRRKLRDPRDVEDAFQATFLILARRARSIRDRDLLGNWLFGVAHRISSRARANAAKRLAREGGPPDSPPLASSFSGYSPERAELSRVLDEEISRLPDPLRRAVLLCYFDGLTHDEASRRLGWPVGTVRSRLARARRTLRVRLTRLGLAPTGTSSALSALLCPPTLSRLPVPPPLLGSTVRLALGTSSVGASSLVGALIPAVGVASSATLASGYMKTLFLGRLLAGLATCLAAGGLVVGSASLGGLIGPETGRIAGPAQSRAGMVGPSTDSSLAPTPDDEQDPAKQARDQLREFTRRSQVEQLELALQERRLAATRAQAEADLARFQANELEFGPDIGGPGDEPGKPTELDLQSRFEAADREWGRFRIRQEARARELEVERDRLRIAAAGLDPERAGEVLIGGLWGRTSSSSSFPTEGQALTIRGLVRWVDLAAGTARISVGTLDGVVPGQTFQLRRPSDMPRDSVGRLRITHAEPDQASGQLENLFEGKPPIVGDLAQLYIPPPGPLLSGDDPEARVGTTTVYISTLSFRVPLALGKDSRDRIKKVELLVSTDEGKQWKVAGEAEPSSEVSVAYTAPRDGAYLFAIRSHKENGQVYPPLTEAPTAKLQVIVDTTKPVIRVVESSRQGGRVRLRWEIDEPNLARDSPTITQNVLGEKSRLAAVASGTGELTWKVDHDGPVSLQIRAEDRAGNTTTLKYIIPPASESEAQTRSDPLPMPNGDSLAVRPGGARMDSSRTAV